MNNMYDILEKMALLESKGTKPDFLDIDKDGDRTEPMKKAAKEKVKEQDAGEYPHRQSSTFGHSHQMKPGYDPTFRSPIDSPAGSEIEELEYLMSKGAMNNAEEMRLRSLYNKFGIRGPQDMAKIPQMRQQELERIGKTQAELQRKSAEANVASRDEMERQRAARMGATAKPRSDISTAAGFRAAYDRAGRSQPAVREGEGEGSRFTSVTPGFDSVYVMANPGSPYINEIEELEAVLSGGGNYFRRQFLLKKYGINKPEDVQKLPAIKAQAMKDIRSQQQQIGKDRAARNAQAAKEHEAELARFQAWDRAGRPQPAVREGEVEEGNEFTQARLAAIKAGKPTFSVAGKTYRVTGDTSDEKTQVSEGYVDFMDKKAQYRGIGAEVEGKSDDYTVTFKDGSRKRYQELDGRRRVTTLEPVDRPEEQDAEGNVVKRGRGRPKGTGRKMGARGKTRVSEQDLDEDYDKDEYDEEGEMAMSQARTIEDAAQELQDILDDDQNLPEWVQKKITLAKEYIDSARDYMKANPDEEEVDVDVDVEVDDEEFMAEKAVSRAQRAAAGIAYAARKGDIPKSELRGASKEMADMPAGELKKFAKTKEKGLPEKKKEVDETTTSGSVATAPAEAPKGKKGLQFGKGVYEGQIAESFERRLGQVLTEGVSINASQNEDGQKSITVTATDDDAMKLAQLLQLAGMPQATGYKSACSSCGGMHEGECLDEADLANSPDEQTMDTDMMVNTMSGGLNGQKQQVNPNNMADNPLAMRNLGSRGASGQLNLGAMAEDIEQKLENRLMDLYKRIA